MESVERPTGEVASSPARRRCATDENGDNADTTRRRGTTWRFVRALLVAQVLFPLMLLGCKNSVLFYPAAAPTPAERIGDLDGTDARLLEVERPDGRRLTGFDARPIGGANTPVLLVFHGNAGNAAYRAPWLRQVVRETGLRVVLASYSGYGGNAGSPSEDEIYADALAFHDHLTRSGVAAERIVVYGESIGGGPASHVATERRCGGLVLQSTFSSLSSMAWEKFWWIPLSSVITRGDFPNADRAGRASETMPVLIVHGTRDRVIPFSEGEALAAAAPHAEFLPVEGADHNDFWSIAGRAYRDLLGARVREWTTD